MPAGPLAGRTIAAGLLTLAALSARAAARVDPPTPAPAVSATAPALASASVSSSSSPQRIAWHLTPASHYAASVQMTHRITYDLAGMYKALAGSKADPVTILEARTAAVTTATATPAAGSDGAIAADESITDVRRYGGDHPSDASVVTRAARWTGSIAADGKRSPTVEPLVDPGEGALAEFPDSAIAPGRSWSFSRAILVERDIGHGTMTYTDTLRSIDVRAGHLVAVIDVKGAGRVDVTRDLAAKGFATTDIALAGTGEFDVTAGLPGTQHYASHAEWRTRVLWVRLGMVFDGTYDASPWTAASR